ncbi:hypothetical protein ACFQAV_08880 [Companilactobacillus huachuanensis]|uniref:Uncharacterized protein n=1 Tax=Companilactobacillus huachuanensis TaxID=2559914 RepID=A0ABW1RNU9_9LACO|nr:hypothetical protein [Companilactobacillus huachuanensis]
MIKRFHFENIIIALLIEWFIAIFLLFPGNMIGLEGDMDALIPTIPSIILNMVILEFARQIYLDRKEQSMLEALRNFGEINYKKYEDVLDRNSLPNSEREILPLDVHMDLDGAEIVYSDNTIYYKLDGIIFYDNVKWQESPTYGTFSSGNFAVTEQVSSNEIHNDWSAIAIGTLYITNSFILFYAPSTENNDKVTVRIGLHDIYFVNGHVDLDNIPDCVRIRTNGHDARDFYFHPGTVSDSGKIVANPGFSLGYDFVQALSWIMALDPSIDKNQFGDAYATRAVR